MPEEKEASTKEVPVGTRKGEPGEGPKYFIDIEGETYPWDKDEITVPELRELGDLPEDLPVMMIDLRTNKQQTLDEDEVVELRPGLGFSKKYRFKRGQCLGWTSD